jgi:glucose/arabinose dehydrogenase
MFNILCYYLLALLSKTNDMQKNYILLYILLSSIGVFAQPKIKLDTLSPIDIANDGLSRKLYIVQQNGIIWTLDSAGNKLDTFIDLRTKVQLSSEQGLLGMAFHPDYVHNAYVYVYYTKKNSNDNNVVRYRVGDNPNRADIDSERVVITLPHPTFTNHNGGCVKFGNDGFLYIAVGDGGSGGDPNGNAQNKNTFLGKLLRIDVNNFAGTYSVPASNPFVGQSNVKQEIWAYGLRNPWRFSFDRLTHDMWMGDVGQSAKEEINFQASTSTGGENYGWRCYEGNNTFNTAGCTGASNYKFPVYDYDRSASGGFAVTGGFVYRGSKYPDFYGYYICADYGTGNFWLIKKNNATFQTTAIGKPLTGVNISAFGEDIDGELYASNVSNGVIYKIRELCSPFRIGADRKLNPSCYNTTDGLIELSSVNGNGTVNYVWSNGSIGNQISNLDEGTYYITATNGIGCVRKDSFDLRRPDTLKNNVVRLVNPSCPNVTNGLIELHATGGFSPYIYNWNNGNTTDLNTNLAPGKYVVTLKDSNNCVVKDSFTLVNADTLDKPIITVNSGQYLQTQTGFTYKWYQNGILLAGSTEDTIHPNLALTAFYQVEITDVNGCKALSDTFQHIVLGTKNNNSNIDKFSLFPNPANDLLNINIDFKAKQVATLKIINTVGQILFSEKIETNKISKAISLQTLPKGMYQLAIFMEDGKVVSRTFVKE